MSEDDGARTRNHRIDSPTTSHSKSKHDKQPGDIIPIGCTTGCTPDPDLSRVVAAWPTLPEPIRRAVLALVEAGVAGRA
jgi:hypothetical protein